MMEVKAFTSDMAPAVGGLTLAAFETSEHGYQGEAELVTALRDSATPTFEAVVEQNGAIIGHVMLSEAWVGNQRGLVLAPISVAPAEQKQGLGTMLMERAEEIASEQQAAFMSILGDPNYYGRFGYEPAETFGVQAPFDVPSEYFMLKVFQPVEGGMLQYAEAFGI